MVKNDGYSTFLSENLSQLESNRLKLPKIHISNSSLVTRQIRFGISGSHQTEALVFGKFGSVRFTTVLPWVVLQALDSETFFIIQHFIFTFLQFIVICPRKIRYILSTTTNTCIYM